MKTWSVDKLREFHRTLPELEPMHFRIWVFGPVSAGQVGYRVEFVNQDGRLGAKSDMGTLEQVVQEATLLHRVGFTLDATYHWIESTES